MSNTSSVTRRGFLRATATAATSFAALSTLGRSATSSGSSTVRTAHELRADILVIGGSFGGVAAALAAAKMGRKVILTEETSWIGGQATTQGVPMDEHPWVEQYGRTATYAAFREGVRAYYRRNYPLTPEARADKFLNPGAGWVSALCYEPRVGLAVLHEMLAPHISAGRIILLPNHRPIAVEMEGDRARAVTVLDERANRNLTLSAPYILDATELGELLELAKVEHVVGAESQSETGEPNALEGAANPKDQMGFTHVFSLDYLPGEEHVIDKPRDYHLWWTEDSNKTGRSKLRVMELFGGGNYDTTKNNRYITSPWAFRRMLCRGNFAAGAFPSDITVAIWGSNEYHKGVLCGVSQEEARKHMQAARQLSLSVIYWLQTEAPDLATGRKGLPGLRPRGDVFGTNDGLAQYPYIRESRRIRAEFTVLETHFRNDRPETKSGPIKFKDSVGVGGYRIDIHKPAKKGAAGSMTGANHGRHWCQQIPLGALIPVRVENLLPACKNVGVTAVTNGAFRLHPVEWNIGEAAGALAAYCIQRSLTPRQVRNSSEHLMDFQRELVRQGVELDWPAAHRETSRSYFSHHDRELKDKDTFYFGEAWRLKGSVK